MQAAVRMGSSLLLSNYRRQIRGQFQYPKCHLFTRAAPQPRSFLRAGFYTAAVAIPAGVFTVYYFDARSALHRYFLTPLLRHTLDPETSHKVAVKVLGSGLAPRDPLPDEKRLRSEVG